ncbi:AAA family ATPase [Hymenobacter weizhouensis]|uniref:AAA family ATPase n=1 Tax=Hymenobacter sp. YIM 151500-1 TaxID=2987689 RepID=UPI00222623C1|nr:AAA family ATPase [Hymenobacter sp. YIM 151500-1]UYZ62005.1 AAA family ATPase [Hymenobacter sp. YIM 151500-1]
MSSPHLDPQLTREQVLRALRQIDREGGPRMPLSTVYDLVYRGRRYAPRAVAQLAYRLATGKPEATWPLAAGTPTNRVLEQLDFTIATKRPTLENSPLLDGDVAAQEAMQELYTGPNHPIAKTQKPAPSADEAAATPLVQEPAPGYELPPARPYGRAEALTELFLSEDQLDAALAALRRRRNVVLQGPPGTGKTFLARRLAWLELGATDAGRVELVQFHPSYSYEDFVQGFRPDAHGTFRLQDGVLPTLCRRAAQDPERPYFLLIDELNRGNVSRIFGELLLLLEADKRGPAHAVRLPYASPDSPPFFVPDNVYVISTMNLADRSLAPLDYALRRRFAFVGMAPEFSLRLEQFLARQGVPAALVQRLCTRLTELNRAITDDPELGSDFCIGHSYFCQPPASAADADQWLTLILEQEICPLLDDYWLDQPAKAAQHKKKLLS